MVQDKKMPETAEKKPDFYKDILFCCLPLLAMSYFLYGPRPLLLAFTAVLTANLSDRLVSLIAERPYESKEYSSESFALLLTLLLPATVSIHVVVVAALACVLLGKEVFGGVGCYPFHPAAVGYVVAAESWPNEVFRYPQPFTAIPLWDASGVATVESGSAALKAGGLPTTSIQNLLLGNYAAPLGTAFTLVILACGLYLFVRGHIDWETPLCFLAACVAVAYLFPRLGDFALSWPWQEVARRLVVVRYEVLSGAMLFSAVFLVCEPVTTPKNRTSRIVYGVLLGFLSMMFRYYGTYETGVCFALLVVNAVSGWLDRAVVRLAGKKEVRRLEAE